MKDHVIGVDIGTTGTKTGIYDCKGCLVGEAYEESILHYPRPGEVEQKPDDIFRSVVNTIKMALQKSGLDGEQIAALAFDGQMAGIMAIDADWQPVTHYDSWLDTRCTLWLEALRPYERDIILSCGMAVAFNHAPKILYWRDKAEIWQKIARFIQPAAWVAGRFAGLKGTDAFMDRTYLAFSGFGNSEAACWNEELLAHFNLTTEKLPRIVEPWEIIGTVQPQWAQISGLMAGTPIAAGCGDQCANVLGAGLVEPGMIFDTSGTASLFATVIDTFGTDTAHRCLITCPHVIPGLYVPMAYVAGGGLNMRWFRDELSPHEKETWEKNGLDPYDALTAMAAESDVGAEKLLFLPHLSGRNTPNDPNLRGAFLGLTWRHGKAHMVRAIMESIAYEYAFYLRAVRELKPDYNPQFALNIGGGARSKMWQQIKADILGLDYYCHDREEFGTLGAAIVAGHACGLFPDLAQTAKLFSGQPTIAATARAAVTRSYVPYIDSYIEALETLSPFFLRFNQRLA